MVGRLPAPVEGGLAGRFWGCRVDRGPQSRRGDKQMRSGVARGRSEGREGAGCQGCSEGELVEGWTCGG